MLTANTILSSIICSCHLLQGIIRAQPYPISRFQNLNFRYPFTPSPHSNTLVGTGGSSPSADLFGVGGSCHIHEGNGWTDQAISWKNERWKRLEKLKVKGNLLRKNRCKQEINEAYALRKQVELTRWRHAMLLAARGSWDTVTWSACHRQSSQMHRIAIGRTRINEPLCISSSLIMSGFSMLRMNKTKLFHSQKQKIFVRLADMEILFNDIDERSF